MSDPRELYQALVLEHGNAPRRQGPLERATHQARVTNPLCGDRVTVRLHVADGRIATLRFEARGCLLATASASILGDLVEGQTVEHARALASTLHALLTDLAPPADLGPLAPLAPVRDFPARLACVELPWKALVGSLAIETPTNTI
jgi:nitrogen fixation protein NifU and related proteins